MKKKIIPLFKIILGAITILASYFPASFAKGEESALALWFVMLCICMFLGGFALIAVGASSNVWEEKK